MTIYAIRALRRLRQRIGRLRQAAGPRRRVRVAHVTPFAAVAASLAMTACSWTAHDVHADGIVWQLDNATINPAGNWQQLGVHELLIRGVPSTIPRISPAPACARPRIFPTGNASAASRGPAT
jgi:hypothetical protein